jgi:hypothetical protein
VANWLKHVVGALSVSVAFLNHSDIADALCLRILIEFQNLVCAVCVKRPKPTFTSSPSTSVFFLPINPLARTGGKLGIGIPFAPNRKYRLPHSSLPSTMTLMSRDLSVVASRAAFP